MYWFASPYFPIAGRSPLCNEYKIPGAWPQDDEGHGDTPAGSPTSHQDAVDDTTQPPASSSSPPKTCPTGGCATSEDDQEEEYDPEYATYLLADMLTREDLEERRRNELVWQLQCLLKKDWTKNPISYWMRDRMFLKDVKKIARGEERGVSLKVVEMERDVGDLTFKLGVGTPAQAIWADESKERRGEEEDERPAKRVREEPRMILKPRVGRVRRCGGALAY